MPRSGYQLRVRDPQILLLLPLLARAHRHAPILRTNPVDTPELSAYESRLTPRAARQLRVLLACRSCLGRSSLHPSKKYLEHLSAPENDTQQPSESAQDCSNVKIEHKMQSLIGL